MTDLDANYYRKNSSTQYGFAHEIVDAIHFKSTETILDVGCGDGRISAELSKCVPQGNVIGLDPSSSMIDLALHSFPKQEYPNLDFKKSAAEGLRLEPFSVDIAFIMNTLHWIRDPWSALRKIGAALKMGGSLFILTFPKESPYWQFLEETLKEKEFAAFADQSASKTILTTHEYITILKNNGLSVEKCSLEEQIAVYPSPDDLKTFVRGWLNCYLPLPKELEETFLQQAVKNAHSFSLTKSGKELQMPYHKLTLIAKKTV